MRSVNSRFLDLAFRLPDEFRALEPALRELLTGRFKRGKVELRLTGAGDAESATPSPRPSSSTHLGQVESRVRELLPNARAAARCTRRCSGAAARRAARLRPRWCSTPPGAPSRAWRRRGRGRRAPGRVLLERVEHLRGLAAAPSRWCRPPSRGSSSASSSAGTRRSRPPARRSRSRARRTQERALNEAAAYAIRIDVAEELARLRSHLDEIARLLAKGGEVGKRLDFLIQELLREANTLGSKSASLELTAISVDMKVAIEQLREQVQNVE